MSYEMNHTLAVIIARQIAAEHGKDWDLMQIAETVGSELPGLEESVREDINNRVYELLHVADVHVSFHEWQIDRKTGKRMTEEEFKSQKMEPDLF